MKTSIFETNLIYNKNRDVNFVHINTNAWVTMTLNNWLIWENERKKGFGWKSFSANEMTSSLETF